MINELLATAMIIAAGAVAVVPLLPVVGTWGHAALTVPSGFALYFVSSVALVAGGVHTAARSMWLAILLGLIIAAAGWSLDGRSKVEVRALGASLAVVASAAVAVSVIAQLLDLTRMSPDSGEYLVLTGALHRSGSLDGIDGSLALIRMLGVPFLHVPGVPALGYMVTWTPLLGAAGLGLLSWLGARAFGDRVSLGMKVAVIGSMLMFLLSANRVLYNMVYINSHLAFAVFLLLGVGAAWHAISAGRWGLLVPAGLGFSALPMLRPEGVIVALLFLVPIITDSRLTFRRRTVLAAPVVVTTVLWHGLTLVPHLSPSRLGLGGPVLSNLLGLVGLGIVIVVASTPRLRRLTALAAPGMLLVIALYVAIRAVQDWEPFTLAVSSMATNLAYDGMWSSFWWFAPLLFAAAVVSVTFPKQRIFVYPLVGWPLALLMFSYLREGDGYRIGTGDSGNRMMMHVVLVLALYLLVATATAATRLAPDEGEMS